MAIYRTIQLSFWTDNKVVDDFTPEDKYFYLYLFTNPQTNLCGCYEISLNTMSQQTGYNKETILRLIERFEKVHNVIRFSNETKEILLLNWSRYNWTKSPDFLKGLNKEIDKVKALNFKNYLLEVRENGTVPRPSIDGGGTTVTVTNTNTVIKERDRGMGEEETNPKPKPKKNMPPTLEDVKAYCTERQNNVDPERFIDYYDSNGWMVGKNKMKDWKAAVRTWERNNYGAGNSNNRGSNDNSLRDPAADARYAEQTDLMRKLATGEITAEEFTSYEIKF